MSGQMVYTRNREMGKVVTTMTVTNRIDRADFDREMIAADKVRSLALNNVLIDTGATTLCLPADIIEGLGLSLLKEVDVEMASGIGLGYFGMQLFIYAIAKERLNAWSFLAVEIP